MRLPALKHSMNWPRLSVVLLTVIAATLPLTGGLAAATPAADVIVLPGAT
jgi:hypothetical protein